MTQNIFTVLLQATPGSPMPSLFLMVGMVIVMYFFMIRPQAKRAKEQKKFSEAIGAGERIITSSGIHGTVSKINPNGTIDLRIAPNTTITVERSAISMELTNAYRKANPSEATAVTPV